MLQAIVSYTRYGRRVCIDDCWTSIYFEKVHIRIDRWNRRLVLVGNDDDVHGHVVVWLVDRKKKKKMLLLLYLNGREQYQECLWKQYYLHCRHCFYSSCCCCWCHYRLSMIHHQPLLPQFVLHRMCP